MRPSIVLAVLTWAGPALADGRETPPPDLAARAWAITDAVLARHVEPPTRQEMILAGLKALKKASESPIPPGLARAVSAMQTPESLADVLGRNWPDPIKPGAEKGPEAAFLDGLLSSIPGEPQLLSTKEWKVEEQMEANLYVGIQVALGTKDGYPTFHQILPGGPADRAGAKAGEAIEAVDGVSTRDMPLREVIDRLRGEEGTEVVVRLRKSNPPWVSDVPMRRERLPRKTVQGLSPLPEGRWDVRLDGPAPIGFLKLTEITGSTPQELRAFASQMESEGLRALVLDLREVHQAGFHPTVLLADALLDGGVIGRVREADSSREIRAEPDALFRDWPMVVLTGDAQPAEIEWLCAGLRDNHRATILGNPGVGPVSGGAVVRSVVPLPGGAWYLKVVTGRLERSDGQPLRSPDPKILDRLALNLSKMAQVLDPYTAEPAGPNTAARIRPQPPASGPPGQARVFIANRPVQEDPLPKARAILEAALKPLAP